MMHGPEPSGAQPITQRLRDYRQGPMAHAPGLRRRHFTPPGWANGFPGQGPSPDAADAAPIAATLVPPMAPPSAAPMAAPPSPMLDPNFLAWLHQRR